MRWDPVFKRTLSLFVIYSLSLTLCDPMFCSTPGLPVFHYLQLAQTLVHWASDAIQPSYPLSSPSPELALHIKWLKHWSFSFSIIPSNEYSGLISFKIDWLDLLAVQRTFKSLFQHDSLKASVLQRSAFFMVQLSHLYMTTGKMVSLTIRIFVGKVMSLIFYTLSRFVIAFLTRSKHFLISWLQSLSADFGV